MPKPFSDIDQGEVGLHESLVSGFVVNEILAQIINGMFFLSYLVMLS